MKNASSSDNLEICPERHNIQSVTPIKINIKQLKETLIRKTILKKKAMIAEQEKEIKC